VVPASCDWPSDGSKNPQAHADDHEDPTDRECEIEPSRQLRSFAIAIGEMGVDTHCGRPAGGATMGAGVRQ
jgi:hypothetical protein